MTKLWQISLLVFHSLESTVPIPVKKNLLLGNGHGKLKFISEKELREHASCRNFLTEGEWSQFTHRVGDLGTLPFTKNPLQWTYKGEFVPSHCQLIDYKPADLQACVQADKNRPKIHFIGDSRTRLLYRAAVATYQNRGIETVDFHDDKMNTPFQFHWGSSFNGEKITPETQQGTGFYRLMSLIGKSQLTVIGEHVLHPVFDLMQHNPGHDKSWYWSKIEKYFTENLDFFEKSLVSKMKYEDENKSVVILSFEGNLRTFPNWNKPEWDKLQEFYNNRMQKIADGNKAVHFMKINSLTSWGPHGEQLFADWTHKLIPESPSEIPSALRADVEFLFNFHCNSKLKNIKGYRDDQVCCLFKD